MPAAGKKKTTKDNKKGKDQKGNNNTAAIVVAILFGAAAIAYAILYPKRVQEHHETIVNATTYAYTSIQDAFSNTTALSELSFEQVFGNWSSFSDDDSFGFSIAFQEKWRQIQKSLAFNNALPDDHNKNVDSSVGERMKNEYGIKPKHPVFMVPGFVTSGLELWEGKSCAQAYFRRKIWGSLETFRSFAMDKECWKQHLMLDPVSGLDPPGIRLRNSQGFEAADFWTSAFWVWDKIIRNLAAVGYDGTSMSMEAYDWRMNYKLMEQRDGQYTKLKKKIEAFVDHANGAKAVIMGHSMGGPHVFAFLVWVSKAIEEGGGGGGSEWVEKYIHAYVDLSGPKLGLPKAAAALLSGEMKDTNMLAAFGGLVENFFGRKKRNDLFSSWGALWSMAPMGGDAIWGTAADVDCGEGMVHHGTDCVSQDDQNNTAPSIPFLTFDDSDVPDYDDPTFAKYGTKSTWSFDDVMQYLSEWKSRDQGPKGLVDAWSDPTIQPLPNAPSLNVYCLYGVGVPTERMYYYTRQNASETDVPFIIDSRIKDDESQNIIYGIKQTNGDGSVPLLSMGYPCVELWKKGSKMNPGNARVITREYGHVGSFQVDDPMRQGPTSSEHCDILGNHEVLEDLIRISAGQRVEQRIVSNIEEIAKKIREHPYNNKGDTDEASHTENEKSNDEL